MRDPPRTGTGPAQDRHRTATGPPQNRHRTATGPPKNRHRTATGPGPPGRWKTAHSGNWGPSTHHRAARQHHGTARSARSARGPLGESAWQKQARSGNREGARRGTSRSHPDHIQVTSRSHPGHANTNKSARSIKYFQF